jgi:lysophospholipase L1-like esterase
MQELIKRVGRANNLTAAEVDGNFTAVKSAVDTLESRVDFTVKPSVLYPLPTLSTKNLFNPALLVQQQKVNADGTFSPGTVYGHSGYQAILPNTTYTLSGLTYDASVVVFFSASLQFISAQQLSENKITFTAPSTAAFVLFNIRDYAGGADYTTPIQLEIGSTVTAFVINHTPILLGGSGSSIMAGYTASLSWIEELGVNLSYAIKRVVLVKNGGVPSDPSEAMLAKLPALLAQQPGTGIWFLEGNINDAKGTDTAVSEVHYRQMITLLKAAGKTPILTTSTPVDTSVVTFVSAVLRQRLNTLMWALAKEFGLHVVDNDGAFAGLSKVTSAFPDGIHPSDEGQYAHVNTAVAVLLR